MSNIKGLDERYGMPKAVKLVLDDGSEHLMYCTKIDSYRHLFAHNELRIELSLVGIYRVGDTERLFDSLKSHVFPAKIVNK